MGIPFVNTAGLFTRVGKLGACINTVDSSQSSLLTNLTNITAQYANTLQPRYGVLAAAQTGTWRALSGSMGVVQQLAQGTVVDMVQLDQPAAARSLSDAMTEVIRQMIATNTTVQQCTVGVTIANLGTPTGSGIVVYSTKRGDGLVQENSIAETLRVVCTGDSYSGGATVGQERFSIVGQSSLGGGTFDYDWPAGSNANASLNAVSADQNASSTGNLLTNGNFETWSGGTPDLNGQNWTVTGGVANTDYAQNSSSPFRGSFDLKFIAGTNATPIFAQVFNSSSGTTANVKSLTSYAVNFWAKRAGTINTGVLTVDLVDGTNTVINDFQGVANSFNTTLSTLTTSYAAYNGVFRLPEVLPSTIKLRFRISTALTGANFTMDDICLTPHVPAYTGGPNFSVFSGVTPFALTDTYTAAVTNNRGGASNLATFQALFDRLFSMRSLGLLLPSSGSPSISDGLIA